MQTPAAPKDEFEDARFDGQGLDARNYPASRL